jgi:hypothetical protein
LVLASLLVTALTGQVVVPMCSPTVFEAHSGYEPL